jgi:hypothetical protein
MKLTSEFADNETDIMRKVLRGGGSLPAAFAYQPFRAGKVVECNKWFYAIFFSSRRKEMLPYVWKGFLTVIGVNAVLLLIYYF